MKQRPSRARILQALRYDDEERRFYWRAGLFGSRRERPAGDYSYRVPQICIDGHKISLPELLKIYTGRAS
jgi:hypothetical protein